MQVYIVMIAYSKGEIMPDRVYANWQEAQAYRDQLREAFKSNPNSGIDFVTIYGPFKVC